MTIPTYGLTGGIATGKSTVSALFAELGVTIIDADVIARTLLTAQTPLGQELIAHIGPQALSSQGDLNRAWLREYMFTHPEEKRWLEQRIHPLIRQQIKTEQAQAQGDYCIMVIPLLIENIAYYRHLTGIIVVDSHPTTQKHRLQHRDQNSAELIEKLLAAQTKREHRLAHAHFVIDNDGDLQHLKAQVIDLDKRLRQLHR